MNARYLVIAGNTVIYAGMDFDAAKEFADGYVTAKRELGTHIGTLIALVMGDDCRWSTDA